MVSQLDSYVVNVERGFEDYKSNPLYVPTKIALIMSECAEALDAHQNRRDDELSAELADIVLRTMNLAEALDIDLDAEIEKKHSINKTRSFMHGNKRY